MILIAYCCCFIIIVIVIVLAHNWWCLRRWNIFWKISCHRCSAPKFKYMYIKRLYNERVIQVEKGSFTPLVFSTFGGLGPECEKFHQRVAQLISKKTNQTYSKVVDHIRTRIRFSLLRSVLISLRGVRGKDRYVTKDLGDVSYELIPSMTDYDGY